MVLCGTPRQRFSQHASSAIRGSRSSRPAMQLCPGSEPVILQRAYEAKPAQRPSFGSITRRPRERPHEPGASLAPRKFSTGYGSSPVISQHRIMRVRSGSPPPMERRPSSRISTKAGALIHRLPTSDGACAVHGDEAAGLVRGGFGGTSRRSLAGEIGVIGGLLCAVCLGTAGAYSPIRNRRADSGIASSASRFVRLCISGDRHPVLDQVRWSPSDLAGPSACPNTRRGTAHRPEERAPARSTPAGSCRRTECPQRNTVSGASGVGPGSSRSNETVSATPDRKQVARTASRRVEIINVSGQSGSTPRSEVAAPHAAPTVRSNGRRRRDNPR